MRDSLLPTKCGAVKGRARNRPHCILVLPKNPIADPLYILPYISSTLSHLVIVESARPQSHRTIAVVDIPESKSDVTWLSIKATSICTTLTLFTCTPAAGNYFFQTLC